MSVDKLFDVKNSFYLGNYQQCINEAQKLSVKSEEEKTEKELFMYRAYIAQGKPNIPLSEIPDKTSVASLKAIRRFAEFQNRAKRTKIANEYEAEISGGSFAVDDTNCIIAANILNQTGNHEDAMKVLLKSSSFEAKAAIVHTLLKMDRVDLAIKQLKVLSTLDEDATLTQLALAWVNLAVGKEKLKDAFYIFQEMMDKYGQTAFLLVGQSSALIMQERFEEAEKLLQDAQQRDASYAETLINLIAVCERLGKEPEVINRYVTQLKNDHPDHPWTKELTAKEDLFDRIAVESSA